MASCNIVYPPVGRFITGNSLSKAKEFGYDGVELGLPDHVDVRRTDTAYYQGIKDLLKRYDLRLLCDLYPFGRTGCLR